MGRMKDFAMDVSDEMGFGGELTKEVLAEAQLRLDNFSKPTDREPDFVLPGIHGVPKKIQAMWPGKTLKSAKCPSGICPDYWDWRQPTPFCPKCGCGGNYKS